MANPSKWTFEAVQQEASLYTTRTEFFKGSSGAYHAAHKNGWLDEVCPHMVAAPRPGPTTKWTFEAIQKEASLYPTRSAFRKGSLSAYNTAHKRGWLDDVCSHMVALNAKLTFENVKNKALLYPTRSAFEKGSRNAYQTARRRGWLDEVCSHMVAAPRPGAPKKWTLELIHREALKYETRSAFQKGFQSAYQTAYKNGWLDQVCTHMKKSVCTQ